MNLEIFVNCDDWPMKIISQPERRSSLHKIEASEKCPVCKRPLIECLPELELSVRSVREERCWNRIRPRFGAIDGIGVVASAALCPHDRHLGLVEDGGDGDRSLENAPKNPKRIIRVCLTLLIPTGGREVFPGPDVDTSALSEYSRHTVAFP